MISRSIKSRKRSLMIFLTRWFWRLLAPISAPILNPSYAEEALVAACLAKNNGTVFLANFRRDNAISQLTIAERLQKVVPSDFFRIEGRLFKNALFTVPDHRVGHLCDPAFLAALAISSGRPVRVVGLN